MSENKVEETKAPRDMRSVEGLREALAERDRIIQQQENSLKAVKRYGNAVSSIMTHSEIDYSEDWYYIKACERDGETLVNGTIKVNVPGYRDPETKKKIADAYTIDIVFVEGRGATNDRRAAFAISTQKIHLRIEQMEGTE